MLAPEGGGVTAVWSPPSSFWRPLPPLKPPPLCSSAVSCRVPFSFQLSLDPGRMEIRVSEFSIASPPPPSYLQQQYDAPMAAAVLSPRA